MSYYIKTQRQGTWVGSTWPPTLFDTRAQARREADELQPSTPSKYGKLIVSKFKLADAIETHKETR